MHLSTGRCNQNGNWSILVTGMYHTGGHSFYVHWGSENLLYRLPQHENLSDASPSWYPFAKSRYISTMQSVIEMCANGAIKGMPLAAAVSSCSYCSLLQPFPSWAFIPHPFCLDYLVTFWTAKPTNSEKGFVLSYSTNVCSVGLALVRHWGGGTLVASQRLLHRYYWPCRQG